MRWSEQVVGTLAILESKQGVAVLGPAMGLLVWLARKEGWKMYFLEARRIHLLTHNALNIAIDEVTQRQPGEHSWRHAPDITATHEELVAGYLGVGWVFTKGPQKQG